MTETSDEIRINTDESRLHLVNAKGATGKFCFIPVNFSFAVLYCNSNFLPAAAPRHAAWDLVSFPTRKIFRKMIGLLSHISQRQPGFRSHELSSHSIEVTGRSIDAKSDPI